jgi:hypothetical protein
MKRLAFAILLPAAAFTAWLLLHDPHGAGAPPRDSVVIKERVPEAAAQTVPAAANVPAQTPAVPKVAAKMTAEEEIRSLRQDVRWAQPVPEPVFADFKLWAEEYAASPTPEKLEEGLKRAEARRAALVDLIEQDPRRALELAVPESVRRTLPEEVRGLLEQRLSGRGDLEVVATMALPGFESTVPPVTRTVRMDGDEYEAFTYGSRESAMTRQDLAIHGIALDGRMAFSEWPARVLEPVEVRDLRAALPAPPLCPVSKMPLDENGDEIVLDFSLEKALWYCQAGHATQELHAAAAAEAGLPPGVAATGIGGGAELPVAESSYTEGTKKMLIIRVDFPDKTGQVVSDTTLTNLINSMATQWSNMSYGKTTWAKVGEGSAFTPTLRLPKNHGNYTGFGTMLDAARAAAEDAGFDYLDYNFEVVVTGDKPDVSFGGVAFVGGRGAWLANGQWNLGVCSHEVGHNFGLNHSGFWDTSDGTATGAGSNVEYGNPFDQMGGASSSGSAHFNARQKNYLDWIPDSAVKKITANGSVTQRITPMDRKDATGFRAIAVDRSSTSQDYWIEYRTAYGSNKWMKDGAVVNFGDVTINNGKPSLLDFTPNTSSKDDCPILIGKTFSDTDKGIHITPVGHGTGTDGVPYMDVTVNRGTFTGNVKPAASMTYAPVNPAVNGPASFTVTASDADGDALAYYWEWGDGTFTANNSTTASHSWDSAGIKTVRCTVSDMKGLTTTVSALVQVGTSSTFFVSGYVRTAGGLPVEGVTVSGSGKSDVTDSEGYYAITGLAAGSVTLTAAKTGSTLNPNGFTNPVTLGPSKAGLNFVAPVGSPVFAAIKPALLDAGSNTGAVQLALTDNDTPVTALTLTGVSSNTAIIANNRITFGTADPRTVTVTAPSGVSGTVEITITATDPENNAATYVWPVAVNGPPVHAVVTQTAAENAPLDIDLRTLVSDERTPDDGIAFRIDRVRNGSVEVLPDGHTARFMPAPFYNGPASFRLVSRDVSLSSRTLLLYDFEPDPANGDGIEAGVIPDLSNFNRTGTLESIGNGEYAAVSDVPPALSSFSTTALNLTENGSGGAAKLKRLFTAAELNWNDADWTFCLWVKRTSTDSEDFVFHLGEGDGHGTNDELELYFVQGSGELRLEKHNSSGVQASIKHPNVPAGEWHYVSVTYDRTAANAGTLALYVNGFAVESVSGVAMALSQTRSMVIGGHADNAGNLPRWLDGRIDDVMIAGSVLSRVDLRQLATIGTAHYLGLADTDTVNVTVTGSNEPPGIIAPADAGMNTGVASAPLPFSVSDAESEYRVLTVTGTSSNPALIPNSGIVVSGPPPARASADIGAVGAAGATTEDHGTFLVSGSGAGITGTADEFRFVSQDVSGDGEWICRVQSVDFINQGSRAGLMVRDGTAAGAAFAMVGLTAGDGVVFQSRTAAGAAVVNAAAVNFTAAPVWLRLVRSGGAFTGYFAADDGGAPGAWLTAGTAGGFTMPAAVKAGMAVTSAVDASLTMGTFDRLSGFSNGGGRSVTLTPLAGQTGTATITLTVSDGASTASGTFLAVVGINTPPVLGSVADVAITDGALPAPFILTVGDLHTPMDALALTASSSDSRILPASRVVMTGTGAQRSVQLRPVPGESGTATVTLSLSDGTDTVTRSFTLTVSTGDPALLVSAGTNWRYLDSGANPAGWQMPAFNDAAWPLGPAQLGFGEGDESTAVNANAARKVTCFRRSFTLTDPGAWAYLKLRVLRDDGAVVWLNGREIWRTNMPAGAVTAATDPLVAVGGADESAWFEYTVRQPGFVAGVNVLAVQLHQKGSASSDLSFDLEARGVNPAPVEAIAAGAVWKYLDTGTDPGAAWTGAAFDDAVWKSGPAQLGYGDGDEATAIDDGPDTARHVTSWFRQKFTVAGRGEISGIGLRVLRDDGVLIWLNGQPLYLNNLPATGVTAATLASAAIATADEGKWLTAWLPADLLVEGENILAAEVHQSSRTSSDLSFDLELKLYLWDALPPLQSVPGSSAVTLSWPRWAEGWKVQSSADLRTWVNETALPAEAGGVWSMSLPRTASRKWFRLVMP